MKKRVKTVERSGPHRLKPWAATAVEFFLLLEKIAEVRERLDRAPLGDVVAALKVLRRG